MTNSASRLFIGSMGRGLIYSVTGGKYTDPISNTVVLSDVDPVNFAKGILIGEFPTSLLRPFIHEATHHTCFNSPVGWSIASLAAAPASDPFSFITGQNSLNPTVHDLIKSRALMEIFSPLLEGLAVFSEFDAVPGESPVISEVLQKTFRVYLLNSWQGSSREGQKIDPWQFTWLSLCCSRTTPSWIDAKVQLLKTGLDDRSGYLLGYLALKSLRSLLVSHCPKLHDSDLFLSFITSYFFSDFLMAVMMVDDSQQVGSIWSYFEDRLEYLYRNVGPLVEEYEEIYGSGVRRPRTQDLRFRGTVPEYYNRTLVNVNELEIEWTRRTLVSFNMFWPNLFKHRHLFRFAAAMVQIELSTEGCFVVRGMRQGQALPDPILVGPVLKSALPDLRHEVVDLGSIEAVLLPGNREMVVGVFMGKTLVATVNPVTGSLNSEEVEAQLIEMSSFVEVEGAMHEIHQRSEVTKGSSAEKLLGDFVADARRVARAKYTAIAFGPERGPEAALLKEEGIFPVLDHSMELLEFASKLSLASGAGILTMERAADLMNVPCVEVKALFDTVQKLSAGKIGFEFFLASKDVIYGSRI